MLKHLKQDVPASIVVFLVALPLCLGIALASGAPPIAGVIAGIVGGLVVGSLSGSQLGVSGPAAGLAVIVLTAIDDLGSYEAFLAAVVIGGLLQLVFGALKMGVLAYYFPSAVIKGMLAGIGVIILLKQIPHAVGYNSDYEGDLAFEQGGQETTLSALSTMTEYVNFGSMLIASVCLGILILWERPFIKDNKALGLVPGPLLAVLAGVSLAVAFKSVEPLSLDPSYYVSLPLFSLSNVGELVRFPAWGAFLKPQVWQVGAIMALVASLETLLCVEAADKLDPDRRITPTNRELFAQGTGNVISGLIGGLPITQVIVRSSANVQSGGKTKTSAIAHGLWILLSLLLIPQLLRLIPLASLAAILFVVGFKLAKPELFKSMYQKGRTQFVPFFATVLGVVFTDLLTGVLIGLAIGIFIILYTNYRVPFHFDPKAYVPGEPVRIELSEDVSFLNKASILRTLDRLPEGAHVVIDASSNVRLDADVEEIIRDAIIRAPSHHVELEVVGLEGPALSRRPASASLVVRQVEEQRKHRSAAEDALAKSSRGASGGTDPDPS